MYMLKHTCIVWIHAAMYVLFVCARIIHISYKKIIQIESAENQNACNNLYECNYSALQIMLINSCKRLIKVFKLCETQQHENTHKPIATFLHNERLRKIIA